MAQASPTLAPTNFAAALRREIFGGSIAEAVKQGRSRLQYFSGTNFTLAPPAVTAGQPIGFGSTIVVPPGFTLILTGLTVSANGAALISLLSNPDSSNGWATYLGLPGASSIAYYDALESLAQFGANGGTQNVPWEGGRTFYENTVLTFRYTPSGTTGLACAYHAEGILIPSEPVGLIGATRVSLVGDSITANSALGNDADGKAYLGHTSWHSRLAALARGAGVDTQIVANYAEAGRTLMEMSYNVQTNKYGVEFDLQVVAGGMNDAALTTLPTQAKFKAAVQSFIDHRDRYWPNQGKKILFCAPSQTDTASRTSGGRIASIRQWMQEQVVAAGGATAGVGFVDWSQAYALNADATLDTNFTLAERTAGNRLHPSGIGSTALGQYTFDQAKAFAFGLT